MYLDLLAVGDDEESYALEFEEPALATLGFAYEERGRLSGGAYHPILRKADSWVKGKLKSAVETRRARAALLLAYDDAVTAAIATLKARGFNSPYLRAFVVARTNPLRFIKGDAAAARGAAAVDDQARGGHGREQDQERGRGAHGRRARGERGLIDMKRPRAVIFDLDGTLTEPILTSTPSAPRSACARGCRSWSSSSPYSRRIGRAPRRSWCATSARRSPRDTY